MNKTVSQMDIIHLEVIRNSVKELIANDCSPNLIHDFINLIFNQSKGHIIKYKRHKTNFGPL